VDSLFFDDAQKWNLHSLNGPFSESIIPPYFSIRFCCFCETRHETLAFLFSSAAVIWPLLSYRISITTLISHLQILMRSESPSFSLSMVEIQFFFFTLIFDFVFHRIFIVFVCLSMFQTS
jgi:hypothetical protein